MIHIVKGFSIVNEGEVDVFMEFSCFFYDPTDVANPTDLGPLPFLNPYYVFHNIVLFVRLGIVLTLAAHILKKKKKKKCEIGCNNLNE